MGERDQLEQDLRIEQMTVNIEKLRQDIRLDQEKARQEMKWETRKIMLQTVLTLAAAVGAGVALGRFWFGS